MSILGWLKGALVGESSAKMEFAPDEQHLHGLDMKAALEAHAAWKTRLEAQIRGDAGETLSMASVAADTNCTLGKWIHGDAKTQFADYPEYEQLRRIHADFHICAGSILCDAHDGNAEAATNALKKDFRHHSDAVQLALVRLYAKANAHG